MCTSLDSRHTIQRNKQKPRKRVMSIDYKIQYLIHWSFNVVNWDRKLILQNNVIVSEYKAGHTSHWLTSWLMKLTSLLPDSSSCSLSTSPSSSDSSENKQEVTSGNRVFSLYFFIIIHVDKITLPGPPHHNNIDYKGCGAWKWSCFLMRSKAVHNLFSIGGQCIYTWYASSVDWSRDSGH